MSVAPIEIGELARMLDQRAREIAPEILPNGRRFGNEWRTGSVADEPGQSLAVHIGGTKSGMWVDFAEPEGTLRRGGDLLKLAAVALFGGDTRAAVAWARSRLGLDGLDPARLEVRRAEAKAKAEADERDRAAEAEKMRRVAQSIWLGAAPIDGSPGELYLAARGIDLALLDAMPRALRYNPNVFCAEAGRALPALVAQVIGLDGTHVATHRIWIEPDGQGRARKHARLEEPKKAIGRFWGGHIPLSKGACGRMTLRDVPAGTNPGIAEGIEDGLTVACACPERRVVAAVMLGNFAAMALPDQVRDVTFIEQNDPAGSPAARTLLKAIAVRQAEGRTVWRVRPHGGVKDVNDMAQGGAALPDREVAA